MNNKNQNEINQLLAPIDELSESLFSELCQKYEHDFINDDGKRLFSQTLGTFGYDYNDYKEVVGCEDEY